MSKGVEYSTFLLLAVLVIFPYLIYITTDKVREFSVSVGDLQASAIGASYESEKKLLFVDQAGKYAVFRALKLLAENGGFIGGGCGGFVRSPDNRDYVLINDVDCRPNVFVSFTNITNDVLSSYLGVESQRFEFFVDKSVYGLATRPVVVMVRVKGVSSGRISSLPNFRVRVDPKLEVYSLVYDFVDQLLKCGEISCRSDARVWLLEKGGTDLEIRSIVYKGFEFFDVKIKSLKNPYEDVPYVIRFAATAT